MAGAVIGAVRHGRVRKQQNSKDESDGCVHAWSAYRARHGEKSGLSSQQRFARACAASRAVASATKTHVIG